MIARYRAALRSLLLASACTACSSHASHADRPPVPDVPLATARVGTFVERVEVTGRVGPPAGSAAKLSFAEAGIVRAIDVGVGQTIEAGTPVAELDRAVLAAPLAEARADARSAAAGYAGGAIPSLAERSAAAKLDAALVRLAALQDGGPSARSGRIEARAASRQAAVKVATDSAALSRARALSSAGVVARKDLDAAAAQLASDVADDDAAEAKVSLAASDFTSELAQARADVAQARSDERTARAQAGVLAALSASARARADAAEIAYENGVLAAPEDGVVLAILKHPGEAVDPSTPVVEVGPSGAREATFTIDADLAGRLAAGDAVDLHVAGADASHGTLVAVVPVVDPVTRLATVVARGVPPDSAPGAAVSATIAVARTSGVIVPAPAIVEDPETGKTVVFVRVDRPGASDPAFAMRTVIVRANDATNAVLSSGLRAGERVAASGGYALLAPTGN